MIKIETYMVGFLQTNCYLIEDDKTSKMALIDPGDWSVDLDEAVKSNKDKIEYILLTHGHFDHIKAVKKYQDITEAKIVACKYERELIAKPDMNLSINFLPYGVEDVKPDIFLDDLDTIMLGETKIELLYTPGHTIGSSCYILDDIIFSGDTLFRGTIGKTDHKTGSYEREIRSLKRILTLPLDYKVYPGHGVPTNTEFERKNNIYFEM